jgi:hypothetical protein
LGTYVNKYFYFPLYLLGILKEQNRKDFWKYFLFVWMNKSRNCVCEMCWKNKKGHDCSRMTACHVLTRWAWYAWPGSYPACYTAIRQRVRRLNYVRNIE